MGSACGTRRANGIGGGSNARRIAQWRSGSRSRANVTDRVRHRVACGPCAPGNPRTAAGAGHVAWTLSCVLQDLEAPRLQPNLFCLRHGVSTLGFLPREENQSCYRMSWDFTRARSPVGPRDRDPRTSAADRCDRHRGRRQGAWWIDSRRRSGGGVSWSRRKRHDSPGSGPRGATSSDGFGRASPTGERCSRVTSHRLDWALGSC